MFLSLNILLKVMAIIRMVAARLQGHQTKRIRSRAMGFLSSLQRCHKYLQLEYLKTAWLETHVLFCVLSGIFQLIIQISPSSEAP